MKVDKVARVRPTEMGSAALQVNMFDFMKHTRGSNQHTNLETAPYEGL